MSDYSVIFSIIAAIIFSIINFFSLRIRRFTGRHKHQVLSLFSGITAAYVFLDLLPSLQQANEYLKNSSDPQVGVVYENAIFLVVFLGFLLFFTLEYIAVNSRKKRIFGNSLEEKPAIASKRVYFVHFFALAFLQFVLSYTLVFEYEDSIVAGLLYTFAVSLHLFVADNTMVEDYKEIHERNGRYIATVIPIIGLIISFIYPEKILEAYILLAFISGAILYQSIKDEIPTIKRRKSLFLFLVGAFSYTSLLLAYEIASSLVN